MVRWRFGASPKDGEAWLKNPSQMFMYVDYESTDSNGRVEWRRLVVGTKKWLEDQLAVGGGTARPAWLAVPAMLVLENAEEEGLREAIGKALQHAGVGLEMFSTPIPDGETSGMDDGP
jgi:hypothetical protein